MTIDPFFADRVIPFSAQSIILLAMLEIQFRPIPFMVVPALPCREASLTEKSKLKLIALLRIVPEFYTKRQSKMACNMFNPQVSPSRTLNIFPAEGTR
jgi:hypothetical protein